MLSAVSPRWATRGRATTIEPWLHRDYRIFLRRTVHQLLLSARQLHLRPEGLVYLLRRTARLLHHGVQRLSQPRCKRYKSHLQTQSLKPGCHLIRVEMKPRRLSGCGWVTWIHQLVLPPPRQAHGQVVAEDALHPHDDLELLLQLYLLQPGLLDQP